MQYRLYFIDQTRHICDVATFDSASDEQAVTMAGRYARGQPMELWRGDRLIQRLQLQAEGIRIGSGTRLPER